jgi:hypothetical protein
MAVTEGRAEVLMMPVERFERGRREKCTRRVGDAAKAEMGGAITFLLNLCVTGPGCGEPMLDIALLHLQFA